MEVVNFICSRKVKVKYIIFESVRVCFLRDIEWKMCMGDNVN